MALNKEVLEKAWANIVAGGWDEDGRGKVWDQRNWFTVESVDESSCRTTGCLAGHIAWNAGAVPCWYGDLDHEVDAYTGDVWPARIPEEERTEDNVVDVSRYAAELLGVDYDDVRRLFLTTTSDPVEFREAILDFGRAHGVELDLAEVPLEWAAAVGYADA